MSARTLVFAVAALAAGALSACSAIVTPDPGRLGPRQDAGPGGGLDAPSPGTDAPVLPPDAPLEPDAGPTCPTSCDDGIACTVDACEAAVGRCTHEPNDAACGAGMRCAALGCVPVLCTTDAECNDDDACNGIETCRPGTSGASPTTGCLVGAPPDCDDRVGCTADACDPRSGCTHETRDAACDDGIDCTADACTPTGCARTPMNALCNGGCRTGAVCTLGTGCTGGTTVTCMADGDPCTADPPACDAAIGMCLHPPRDDDGDGFPAARATGSGGTVSCPGGTDCNDASRAVNPGATEICNGIDDDCDGTPDDGLTCMGGTAETCATAQPIPLVGGAAGLAGRVTGTTATNLDDYLVSCGRAGGRDAVYYFDLVSSGPIAAAYDVVISTRNAGTSFDTVLASRIGGTCGSWGACNDDVSGSNRSVLTHCVTLAASVTRVHVLVDGFDGSASGTYELTVAATPRATPCP